MTTPQSVQKEELKKFVKQFLVCGISNNVDEKERCMSCTADAEAIIDRISASDPEVVYSDSETLVNLEARIKSLEAWRDSFRKILTNAVDTMP